MTTEKQRQAAKENIKEARKTWREMTLRQRSRAQPEGRGRAKPGARGEGDFFHVEVRPKSQFQIFRTQDVGEGGGIERVAGKRSSGSWDTQKWLISKKMAHIENGTLVADHDDARQVLDQIGSAPEHMEADRFRAKPRPNVPEKDKPTKAQKRARQENIKKAQAARH